MGIRAGKAALFGFMLFAIVGCDSRLEDSGAQAGSGDKVVIGDSGQGAGNPVQQQPPSWGFPEPTPTAAPTADPSGGPAGGGPVEAQKVLSRTNDYRAQNGLAPLAWNAQLGAAAQAYAERMANEGFFDHTSPDGVTLSARIKAAGYDGWTYGENIAYGYATPEAVMQGWISSSGHRANLLGQSYEDLGVGYARSKSGMAYWVQNFGAR